MELRIATCQFPVTSYIQDNLVCIIKQMETARRKGAHVASFPEYALTGSPGKDFKSFHDFNWDLLKKSARIIMESAGRLKLWVVLGSIHPLSGEKKPHNSAYVINAEGEIVDRYDKRFCTGDPMGKTGNLRYHSPGSHFSVFDIRGIKCGILLCHDFRYCELYREYKKRGVRLLFILFANVVESEGEADRYSAYRDVVPAALMTHSANNYIWISANNSSCRYSLHTSFFVRPDGVIEGKLPLHRSGILMSILNTRDEFLDASFPWRSRAMEGVLYSGNPINDSRSDSRKNL